MGKILGEVFDKYVDEQIKTRQKSLGKSQKSTDDLVVFNSSTPWIRLSSSVEVDKDRAKTLATNLGINESEIVGRNLAKNLVLFAGTSDGADLSNRKGGVGYGLSSSYGFLSGQKQGYRPMPGVTGISASYKNNGTLKQAQVSLKCFTREQFEAVEALYLRLGYTMILEWGHSVYFDNSNKRRNMSSLEIPNILFVDKIPPTRVTGPDASIDFSKRSGGPEAVKEFEKDFPTYSKQKEFASKFGLTVEQFKNTILNNVPYSEKLRVAIEENKKKTSGNYDAMIAKVGNFSWNLNDDLSYNITLDLVSVGDIIDSLKMNFGGINITSINTPQIKTDAGIQNLIAIQLASGASAFNTFLFELTKTGDKEAKSETDEITQEQLKLKDDILKVANQYADDITNNYPPVIAALKKQYITPYKEVQNLLVGKKVTIQPSGGIGSKIELESEKVKNELKEKLSGSLKELGSLEGRYKFFNEDGTLKIFGVNSSTRFSTFLANFDLVVETSNNTIRKDTKDEVQDTELSATIKDLDNQLTTIEEQVNKVVIVGRRDGEENNIKLLTYLSDNKNRAKEVILDALFDGFYDGEDERKFKSNAQTEDSVFYTTIVRKWVGGE